MCLKSGILQNFSSTNLSKIILGLLLQFQRAFWIKKKIAIRDFSTRPNLLDSIDYVVEKPW